MCLFLFGAVVKGLINLQALCMGMFQDQRNSIRKGGMVFTAVALRSAGQECRFFMALKVLLTGLGIFKPNDYDDDH